MRLCLQLVITCRVIFENDRFSIVFKNDSLVLGKKDRFLKPAYIYPVYKLYAEIIANFNIQLMFGDVCPNKHENCDLNIAFDIL